MKIITDYSKLVNLTDEEFKVLKTASKDSSLTILGAGENNSIPISLIPLCVSYGDKMSFKNDVSIDLNNPFSLGLLIGYFMAQDKNTKFLLSTVPSEQIEEITSAFSKEFGSEGASSSSKKKANADGNKVRKPRTPKADSVEVDKELTKMLSEDKNSSPLPSAEVQPTVTKESKTYNLIPVFKGTANLNIANIMNDKKETARLVECVKKASDKKIGLPFLLQTYFGKEIADDIASEVAEKFDFIQGL